jgi:outer membrane protein assembly factor BamB
MKPFRVLLFSRIPLVLCLAVFSASGCSSKQNHAEVTGAPHIRWSYTSGSSPLSGIALAPNGNVHFAADDGIYALSPEGKLLWRTPLASGPVIAAPAIAPNGTLYAASKSGSLVTLDASGRLTWESANTQHKFYTPPALGNGDTVYVTDDYTDLFAFSPSLSRDVIWKQMTYSATGSRDDILLGNNASDGDGTWRSSPLIGADDMIYLAHQQWLYRLNVHGDVLWFIQLRSGHLGFPAIGGDGLVYIAGQNPPWLFAIGHDGKQRWVVQASGPLRGSPAVDKAGVIYFCDSNSVKALLPDSQSKWYVQAQCNSGPALAADGTLYLGMMGREEGQSLRKSFISAFTADAHLKWKIEIEGLVREAPAIAPDGTIFFTTDRGYVYAVTDAASPPMDSPWPRFQHDAQNSGRAPFYR